jgi:hypothetical protein
VTRDLSVVRKAEFPTVPEFDAALEELADYLQLDGERYYKAYARAMESPDGQLLYAARSWATNPDPVWKREAPVLSKSEQAIADAVAAYTKEHPGCTPEKGLLQVLEARPELYQAYEREKAAGQ